MLEFPVDSGDYERFVKFVTAGGTGKNEALRLVLTKGMETYWPRQMAAMASDYERLKHSIERYRRDNEILNRLYSQNSELKKVLNSTNHMGESS